MSESPDPIDFAPPTATRLRPRPSRLPPILRPPRATNGNGNGRGRGNGRGKGKGKTRAREPTPEIVEAEYTWFCPVTGCARPHVSVKVRGVWRMDGGRGAVGVYV
ncbi:hypothetical protein BD410DRAFT_793820 [Rickenella mellea]|uniref:Uncharacterized protein n=1 Tax=Rickenella mellea TaxID=50990 RepID=A0A4Y7PRZ7_9AGAM|nr:hypothetical protein BD410DRAFT_793820 [Rickenella mellea]